MTENPYTPPESESPPIAKSPFRELVLGWEKLRLLYNGLLLLPGLMVIALFLRAGMPVAPLLALSLAFAAGANLCFLLGPLAELYLAALRPSDASSRTPRRLLFGAGLAASFGIILIVAITAALAAT